MSALLKAEVFPFGCSGRDERQPTLPHREVDRSGLLQVVSARPSKQSEAARQPGLSVHQVKQLCRQHRGDGAARSGSRHRGQRPNTVTPNGVLAEVSGLRGVFLSCLCGSERL